MARTTPSWLRFLTKQSSTVNPPAFSKRPFRDLFVEELESRIVPATRIWDGGGADALWSNPQNWSGNVAPQPEDNLLFPAGASRLTNFNDFASGTRFRSVTMSDPGYVINELTPGADKITLLEGLVYNATASGAQFNVTITLGASQTFFSANTGATITLGGLELANLQTLTLDGRGNIDVEGAVSGSGGITKLGDGTLILAGNNTFDGLVNITQGIVNLRSNTALGSVNAGTIAGLGTVIQVQNNITVAENFVMRDVGVGFDFDSLGAIRSVGGINTLTGVIAMTNHSSFGVDAGSRLIVSGQIMVEPGVSDGGFTKFGPGTLELAGTSDNVITGPITVREGTLALNKDRSGSTTPLPFNGSLVIGDNRDGVGPEAAKVQLLARDQIPELNFFKTAVNTVTVNSTGTLDLNGFRELIGSLTMLVGRSRDAQV